MATALAPSEIIYRWDLDKTYLRTEFDSVRDLLRTALEAPAEKRTVPGASTLLRELRATGPAAITILSGSPEQMRKVLEAKLRLDGIRWDSFTLKPSLRKLLRGKVRFLKDQVTYKLAALLEARSVAPPETHEFLFGDDAEADAFIYSLYADLGAGRVGTETLMKVLERARCYRDEIPNLVRLAARIPRRDHVRRIFIHLERTSSADVFAEFGQRVCPFYNYLQPSVLLMQDGILAPNAVLRVATELVISQGFGGESLAASVLELARRRYVGRETALRLADAARDASGPAYASATPALHALAEALSRRAGELGEPAPLEQLPIDYVDLFSRDKARARAARNRVRWQRP
ncbi:MAG: hypothetical protein KF901_33095 [Myxococcales bacterium]|nr:hypothetical protein [Myxococcales bacterium]